MAERPSTEAALREGLERIARRRYCWPQPAAVELVKIAQKALALAALRERPSDAALVEALRQRAAKEPLGVDISDYSDEFCQGFLRGQVNVLEEILREHFPAAALRVSADTLTEALEGLTNQLLRTSPGHLDTPAGRAALAALAAARPDAPKEDSR